MRPARHRFRCWRGTTFEQPVILKQTLEGPVMDLTGYSARFVLGDTYSDATPVLTLTSEPEDGNRVSIDAEAGMLTIFIDDTTTSSLAVKKYKFDLEIISPSERVYRPMTGTFVCNDEVESV